MKNTVQNYMYIQMVFLVMNTWRWKHIEDANNWIKKLILKSVHLLIYFDIQRNVHRDIFLH